MKPRQSHFRTFGTAKASRCALDTFNTVHISTHLWPSFPSSTTSVHYRFHRRAHFLSPLRYQDPDLHLEPVPEIPRRLLSSLANSFDLFLPLVTLILDQPPSATTPTPWHPEEVPLRGAPHNRHRKNDNRTSLSILIGHGWHTSSVA